MGYIIVAILFTFVLYIVANISDHYFHYSVPHSIDIMLIGLGFLFALVYFNVIYFKRKNPKLYVVMYLLAIAIKLIAGLGFLALLLYQHPSDANVLVIWFLMAYTGHTALLVWKLSPKKSGI